MKKKITALLLVMGLSLNTAAPLVASYAADDYELLEEDTSGLTDENLGGDFEEELEEDLPEEASEDLSLKEEFDLANPLSKSEVLEGATLLEDNKVKNVPLMKAYQEDIISLAEDRSFDLPPQAQKFNETTIYDLDSILPRIKLMGLTFIFIHRCSTELLYKVQEAHNRAAAEVFQALVTAVNPWATIEDIDKACDRISTVMDELKTYKDLTSEDLATIYVKRVFNKSVANGRNLLRHYYQDDLSEVGVMGKRQFVQTSLRRELDDVSRATRGQVTVATIVELDARLKSACITALLEPDVAASKTRLRKTIDPQIKEIQDIARKVGPKLPRGKLNDLNAEVARARKVRNIAGVSYARASDGVYTARDMINGLREKYPREFEQALLLREGEEIYRSDFHVQSELPDPARINKIIRVNNPSFDFTPEDFQPDPESPIIVGYGNKEDKLELGSYETYRNNKDKLRSAEEVIEPDFDTDEVVSPDFEEGQGGYIINILGEN